MNKPSSKLHSVADLIQSQMTRILGEKIGEINQIRHCWPQIVGPLVAQRSRVLNIERKRLVVGVRDSVWMTELSLQKETILEKFGELFPAMEVNELKLKLEA